MPNSSKKPSTNNSDSFDRFESLLKRLVKVDPKNIKKPKKKPKKKPSEDEK